MNQPTWEEEFDKNLQWVEIDGLQIKFVTMKNTYIDLKSFVRKTISQQRKEIVEWSKQLIGKHNARILNEFQKQGTTEMPFIAYDERVCLIPAITIAMEETDDDIITKLSEEK